MDIEFDLSNAVASSQPLSIILPKSRRDNFSAFLEIDPESKKIISLHKEYPTKHADKNILVLSKSSLVKDVFLNKLNITNIFLSNDYQVVKKVNTVSEDTVEFVTIEVDQQETLAADVEILIDITLQSASVNFINKSIFFENSIDIFIFDLYNPVVLLDKLSIICENHSMPVDIKAPQGQISAVTSCNFLTFKISTC